jgi:5'-nucleotidase
VLLTNDDGIHAPGLHALASQLAPLCDLIIVAPDRPQSASSHSITLHKPLRLTACKALMKETGAANAYQCSGSPADCVTLSLQHLCLEQPPHLVLSGINDGPNLAEDLIYSGTVAGAVEGAIHGIPAIAISLEDCKRMSYSEAAELTVRLIHRLLYRNSALYGHDEEQGEADCHSGNWPWRPGEWCGKLPDALSDPGRWWPTEVLRTPCFNVNIPDLPVTEVNGVRWTALGHREYKDVVEVQHDPRGRPLYWIWGERITPAQPFDSDIRANAEGYVSVTPLRADLLNRSDLPHYLNHFSATSIGVSES